MRKLFIVAILSILLLVPLGLSLTPKDVSSTVWIEITKDQIVQRGVDVPLGEIECNPENKVVFHRVEGSRALIFLSGDSSGNSYSDVSSRQILDKIRDLTKADVDQLKRVFQLLISGSLLETRDWYVYEDTFRVIEGNILSKNSPRLPNVNPPELIGKFKLELPVGTEHKFNSGVCPNIVDPIPFNNLPEGQKYALANDPQNEKLLSSLVLGGESLLYFSSWGVNKLVEDPNFVSFDIADKNTTLSVKSLKDDPELSQEQEAKNFLASYGDVNASSQKQDAEFTIYSLNSSDNLTKTSASVYVKGKSLGFVYKAPKTSFDIYKDMVEFVENSIGKQLQTIENGPKIALSVLKQGCENNTYNTSFKLEVGHKENIDSLEYRFFLDNIKIKTEKLPVQGKIFSSEINYSFNASDGKTLEVFAIANSNNSISYESKVLTIDKTLCKEPAKQEPIQQPQQTQDNNLVIFVAVIAFVIGLGLMAMIKR